jgi:hypothetical protein
MKISTILIFVLFTLTSKAQSVTTTPKNYIGLGIGYRFDNLNDQNFSPLNQKGGGLFYSLFYEKRGENILKLSIDYSNGTLASGADDAFESTYYAANIGVSYFKNLSPSEANTKFYIGGTYNLDIYYMDWSDQDAFSYITANGLSIAGAINKHLNDKQFIESSISFPFLQFLSRPPYNGINEFIIENQDSPAKIIFDGDLTSLHKFQSFTWDINYNLEVSNHINWRLNYALNVKKVAELNEFKSVSNRVSTSMSYKF